MTNAAFFQRTLRTARPSFTPALRRRMRLLACAAAPLMACVGGERAEASGSDLAAFLERAERMAAFTRPVRADIRVVRDGAPVEHAVMIADPAAGRQFFALKSSGWRALMPLEWGNGKVVKKDGARPAAVSVDEPLPATDLRAMEFFPFWKTDYMTAFISDANRLEKTVTLYGREPAPYVLFVITFDKEKLVPLTLKYYRENMNNLVRLRRDSEFTMVGSRPRPRRIEIRDYTENSNTTLEIDWRVLDQVPAGLTTDDGFHKVALEWPAEPLASH
jgi:hypothetical protein